MGLCPTPIIRDIYILSYLMDGLKKSHFSKSVHAPSLAYGCIFRDDCMFPFANKSLFVELQKIFPPELKITLEDFGHSVRFTNVGISCSRTADQKSGKFSMSCKNSPRCDLNKFRNIDFIRFPNPHTQHPIKMMCNLPIGELHRFFSLHSRWNHFCKDVAELILGFLHHYYRPVLHGHVRCISFGLRNTFMELLSERPW